MTGLVHIAAHYYKQALTLPSEVDCHSSMASSRKKVRIFPTIFPTKRKKKRIPCKTIFAVLSFFLMLHVSCSAVSCAAGGFEERSSVQFVVDLQIKQFHTGFALLKNILHYLIHSFSQQRFNQLPVLNKHCSKLHLFD